MNVVAYQMRDAKSVHGSPLLQAKCMCQTYPSMAVLEESDNRDLKTKSEPEFVASEEASKD